MPVSHIGLTVASLATAKRFYQKILQPLGYRIVRQDRDQVAFGVTEPDFFICQDPSRGWPSGTHIAFLADSAADVDAFYYAALAAGGHSHSAPKHRGENEASEYNASIIDLDNNAVEVIHGAAVIGSMSSYNKTPQSSTGANPRSRTPLHCIVNSLAMMPPHEDEPKAHHGIESKTIVGTLLGAAAGAVIAYAMARDENSKTGSHESPREVLVRHTVEYRRAPGDGIHSDSSETYRRHGSDYSLAHSLRRIDAPQSEYTIESAQSSRASRPHPATLALPAPPSPPLSFTTSKARSSARSSAHEAGSSHRSSSRRIPPPRSASISPHEIPLPCSTQISTHSRSPETIPLPPSTRASSARSGRDISLPLSAGTSFLSRPPSPPRSERSSKTVSTVRPLTKRNVSRMDSGIGSYGLEGNESGAGVPKRGPAASDGAVGHDWDDLDTVAPRDSISQVSERPRRMRREVHEHRAKGKGARTEESSKASSTRHSRRGSRSGARSSVKVFGFGG